MPHSPTFSKSLFVETRKQTKKHSIDRLLAVLRLIHSWHHSTIPLYSFTLYPLFFKNMARSSPLKSPPRPQPRPRMNSKDIPRTYSGLYGDGSDLLPFELSRNRNTDWMSDWWLLWTYLSIIAVGELLFLAIFPPHYSWTIGHFTHFCVTLVYLHWIKGSPNFYEQGEMNAMTLWEQLVSTPNSRYATTRRVLLIVPTLLCYFACHFSNYNIRLCVINIILWAASMLAKMSCMNGVRILGINRTCGIDDEVLKKSE